MDIDLDEPDHELKLLRALLRENVKVDESFDDDVPEMPWIAAITTRSFGAMVRCGTRSDARWRLVDIAST